MNFKVKEWLKSFRYKFLIGRLLLIVFYPLIKISIFFLKLRPHIKINDVSLEFDRIKLRFPKNVGINIATKIFWFGDDGFESDLWRVMKTFAARSNVFFDVGSNFGFYSVLVSKVNSNIVTFAFEPVPGIYQANLQFHRLNQCSVSNVFNYAISDKIGDDKILFPKGNLVPNEVSSATLNNDFFTKKGFDRQEIPIKCITLDSFIENLNKKYNDNRTLVKIDVEGHECSVLRGAEKFIDTYKPIIIIEIFLSSDSINYFEQWNSVHNYVLFVITPIGLIKTELKDQKYNLDRNYLLIPSNLVEQDASYIPFGLMDQKIDTQNRDSI